VERPREVQRIDGEFKLMRCQIVCAIYESHRLWYEADRRHTAVCSANSRDDIVKGVRRQA
jgi:hypothetical protein